MLRESPMVGASSSIAPTHSFSKLQHQRVYARLRRAMLEEGREGRRSHANGTALCGLAGTAKCQSIQRFEAHVPSFPGCGLECWNGGGALVRGSHEPSSGFGKPDQTAKLRNRQNKANGGKLSDPRCLR